MQDTNKTAAIFHLIDSLPADFHEVHGRRPRLGFDGFTLTAIPAWLDTMHAACADSAQAHMALYEATGDDGLLGSTRQYLAAAHAIQDLRAA